MTRIFHAASLAEKTKKAAAFLAAALLDKTDNTGILLRKNFASGKDFQHGFPQRFAGFHIALSHIVSVIRAHQRENA